MLVEQRGVMDTATGSGLEIIGFIRVSGLHEVRFKESPLY